MSKPYYNEWIEAINNLAEFVDEYTRPTVEAETTGLYLLEQCACDPHTKQMYYWVKVGQSNNITSRMKNYACNNPAYFLLDTMELDRDEMGIAERMCQLQLMQKAIARGKDCREWFLVDEKTFFEIEAKKFEYFFTVA